MDADEFSPDRFLALGQRWIGLPHSHLRNLNIYSSLPLEVDEQFKTLGLDRALQDMAARSWRPSELLRSQSAGELARVDLSVPCEFCARPVVHRERHVTLKRVGDSSDGRLRVAAIGLGNWSTDTLLQILRKHPRVRLLMGIDRDPMQLQMAARMFGFEVIASEAEAAFASPEIDAIFIATQHDSHAEYALRAMQAGKKVFVEKPPVLSYDELDRIVEALRCTPKPFLAVGYNRAHWVWTDMLRAEILKADGPASVSALVRELEIPRTHPYNWPQLGPRVISNGCHWIDLAHRLLGSRMPKSVQVVAGEAGPEANNVVLIRYADGSLVSLTFSDRGDLRPHVHEYIDIKARGLHFMVDDFKRLTQYEDGWMRRLWSGNAERGWEREVALAVDGMLGGPLPRPYDEVVTSAMLILEARLSFEAGGEVRNIDPDRLHAYWKELV
jgi:predicted dehydrogenase